MTGRNGDGQAESSGADLRALLEAAAQALWETDAEGLVGQDWIDAVHPEDRARAARAWRQAVAAGREFGAEFRLRRADGSWRWTDVRAVPVRDADGAVRRWLGMNIDIDERTRAERALQASEAKYRALFDSTDEGFSIVEVQRDREAGDRVVFREVNRAFERQTGLGDVVGRSVDEVMPEVEARWADIHRRVVETGRPERVEGHVAGAGRWFTASLSPVAGSDPPLVAVVLEDITTRRRAAEALRRTADRQAFVLGLSDALRPLADPAEIQGEACRLLGRRLDAQRVYYVHIDEARGLARVERDHVRGGASSLVGEHPTSAYGWILPLLRAGRPLVVGDAAASDLVPAGGRATMEAVAVRALVGVPLVKQGVLAGALCVTDGAPRRWMPEEVELAEETAERIWAAVERAEAERAAQRADIRMRALADAVPVLIWEADHTGVVFVNQPYLEFFGVGFEAVRGTKWTRFLHPDDEQAYRAARARAAARRTPYAYDARFRSADGRYRWLHTSAQPAAEGRYVGCSIDVTALQEDRLASGTRETALRVSAQGYRRAYESEHEIAGRLQESMLADDMPAVDGATVHARYLPATDGLRVGGDWHESVPLPGGRLGLCVGDVVGSGIDAATTMGRLRSAASALAPVSAGPADLLLRLDRFATRTPGARMATIACAVVDPLATEMAYACAGHPPPLVIGPDGDARYLMEGRGTPLACSLSSGFTEARAALAPGARVLLYSDGLVERRGESLDAGLERLRDAAVRHRGLSPARFCDALVADLFAGHAQDDDVALLCLELAPAGDGTLRLRVPARRGELAGVRRRVRAWLEGAGVEAAVRDDVLLACGEACANAVEHAYPPGEPGDILVRVARAPGGGVDVTVRDDGRWVDPPAAARGGRGLDVIRRLVDELSVESDGGTAVHMVRRPRAAGPGGLSAG